MNDKTMITTGLLGLMAILGTTDALLTETVPTQAELANNEVTVIQIPDGTEPVTPPPAGGIRKADGPDVLQTLVSHAFTFQDTKERMILSSVLHENATLRSQVLLRNGDRAGTVAWVTSPDVKQYYLVLKETLHAGFTPSVQDLLDETQRREGKPVRNLLTFLDTGLLPERVVFVRVRERLYEFHVADGASDDIFDLIEELTE